MTWTNQSKDASTFTNQPFGAASLTWNEATLEWQQEGTATWDNPQAWQNQSKDTTVFTNETKH